MDWLSGSTWLLVLVPQSSRIQGSREAGQTHPLARGSCWHDSSEEGKYILNIINKLRNIVCLLRTYIEYFLSNDRDGTVYHHGSTNANNNTVSLGFCIANLLSKFDQLQASIKGFGNKLTWAWIFWI